MYNQIVDITKVKNIVTWSIFNKPEKNNRYLNCSFLKAVEMSRFLSFNLKFQTGTLKKEVCYLNKMLLLHNKIWISQNT